MCWVRALAAHPKSAIFTVMSSVANREMHRIRISYKGQSIQDCSTTVQSCSFLLRIKATFWLCSSLSSPGLVILLRASSCPTLVMLLSNSHWCWCASLRYGPMVQNDLALGLCSIAVLRSFSAQQYQDSPARRTFSGLRSRWIILIETRLDQKNCADLVEVPKPHSKKSTRCCASTEHRHRPAC